MVMEEPRWEAVSPASAEKIPLFHADFPGFALKSVEHSLCWLLGPSVHESGKMRRGDLASSTSSSSRNTSPSDMRLNKASLHTFESPDLSDKTKE
jgi:hypothetical protein